MFGISYSGFIAIQMAMRQPPALKTILAIDSTEYLYAEDSYFIDGILHLDSYEMMMDVDNSRPGAPGYVIDEAYFRDRFDQPPYTIANKRHQRDGPYWDRVSLKDRYELIRIPSFHIGGWYDGYRNSLPRMLEHLDAPVKAIIGPWIHTTPDDPYPEPGIEWRAEAVRWFDQWLKGRDTGILEEPDFAVYVRNWHPPGPYQASVPGHWRWEEGWPIDRIKPDTLYLGVNHQLHAETVAPATHLLRNVPTAGMEAGGPNSWWGEVAHDQRPTDAYSLVYDSEVLPADLEILGRPRAHLRVAADAPRADWFVRLSDIAPDGSVTLVTGAGFNGTHRDSARDPSDIVPGEIFRNRPGTAFHFLGFSRRTPHPGFHQQCAVADVLAHRLPGDHFAVPGRPGRFAHRVAGGSLRTTPGACFPAACIQPGSSRLQPFRYCRNQLRLWRDFRSVPQSANSGNNHPRQHRIRPAPALGHRGLQGVD